mgnify:CR=1 FL=1
MAPTIQLKRGDEGDRSGETPAAGEPLWVEDTFRLWVGDGSTAGGKQPLAAGGGGSGTAFPTAGLQEGDQFYRTDLEDWFYYDTSRTKWLSMWSGNFTGESPSANTGYFYLDAGTPEFRYSSSIGNKWTYTVVVTEMFIMTTALSTCTLAVVSGGTTNAAAVSLSGARTATASGLDSGVLAAGDAIGMKITSGTATVRAFARAQYRRTAS